MPYNGETLDVNSTLLRLNQAARSSGFAAESLFEQDGFIVPVFTRPAFDKEAPRVYISTGMHGDEPAGPLTVLDLLERDQLCRNLDWTVIPMFNPAGLKRNQRENHQGVDLNRDYRTPTTQEVVSHQTFIENAKRWDLALVVHEDWGSDGFYLYDVPTALTRGWSKSIIETVRAVCPIDLSSAIDEMPAQGGIITPNFALIDEDPKLSGQWAETIYLHMAKKIRGTYTFEAPSSYDLPTRIQALKTAILKSVELLTDA